MYEIVATNLKMAREKKDSPKDHKPIQLQPGDMVMDTKSYKRTI